jgi:hypothetical protein
MSQDPETVKGTLQCHRQGCGQVYPIRARHYQEATPAEDTNATPPAA